MNNKLRLSVTPKSLKIRIYMVFNLKKCLIALEIQYPHGLASSTPATGILIKTRFLDLVFFLIRYFIENSYKNFVKFRWTLPIYFIFLN